jgi:hypothetical protein
MIANMARNKRQDKKEKIKGWRKPLCALTAFLSAIWKKSIWNKALISLSIVLLVLVGSMYGIAQWYIFTHRNEPLQYGVTFIPSYARYLGVEPKETFSAILTDLRPSHVRLVSYWDQIEKTRGVYDFSELDWQMDMAQKAGADVTLAICLRQPRWPECHMTKWYVNQSKEVWYSDLKKVMTATIDRYKTHPALESYQLENEFFLSVFGECPDFSRDRLVDEFNMVKRLDPTTPVIISRSNNAIGFPINEPKPDAYGVSVYKRVWDKTLTKRYVEYPFPAWFYGFLAGGSKLIDGRELMIHELQAEAWTPDGYEIKTAPTSELYKSMNPERLQNRFEYARASGMKRMDLWGVEWWYAMKVNRGEPGLWNTAVQEFQQARQHNETLQIKKYGSCQGIASCPQ